MDNNQTEDNSKWIPEGFVEVLGLTGDKYLVPEFYAPLVALKAKNHLDLENVDGTVSIFWNFLSVPRFHLFLVQPGSVQMSKFLRLSRVWYYFC